MIYGQVVLAVGVSYIVNKSTNPAVNVGVWMMAAAYLASTFAFALATDDPLGVHTLPGRAWRFLFRSARPRPLLPSRLTLVASPVDPEGGGGGSGKEGGTHTVHLQAGGWPGGKGPWPGSGGGRMTATKAVDGGGSGPVPDDVVLEWLIGTGSFASVFRASYAGAPCAVKVLSAASASRRVAARAEAEIALSLRHPCVLATFAVLDVDIDESSLAAIAAPHHGRHPRRRGRSGIASSSGGSAASAAAAAAATTTAAMAEFGAVLGGGGGKDEDEPDTGTFPAGTASTATPGGLSSSFRTAPGTAATTTGTAPSSASSRRQQTWIVQELADRGTLDRAIREGVFRRTTGEEADKDGASPAATASLLATLHDIASGLAYLHAVGIVHGDLKPANILLRSRTGDAAGRAFSALVADFGLSRVLATAPSASPQPRGAADAAPTHMHTHTFGTVCYVSPELIKEGRLSRAADLYSLGIVMWELWSGVPPFEALHWASIFYGVGVEGRRPEPALVGAPPDYAALMEGLWADAVHARPSAADAARRLAGMLEAELQRRADEPSAV